MIEDSAFAFQTFRDYRNSGETPGLPTRRVRVSQSTSLWIGTSSILSQKNPSHRHTIYTLYNLPYHLLFSSVLGGGDTRNATTSKWRVTVVDSRPPPQTVNARNSYFNCIAIFRCVIIQLRMRILLQSFVSVILFSIVSVRVRAIKLCCPEGEIYSKIGVENTVRFAEIKKCYVTYLTQFSRIAVRRA